ncbi:class I SAM-dependent methyltransferase [Thermosynechococcus sp. QS41]|uniref:class I SAM-dependent methyltransferase n=1 Tax=Thermosynechococcus sp. QS41 TaxID=3074101 RepID=UPI00287730D6|nr:class I SAM-dependent methyltransferase [Thermosynechococcus sp. QS41]WNC59588.1 class I SAM-dependent methyltransferase [Thermosynechococcus sp. QS41]
MAATGDLEKIRRQFDYGPYPRVAIDKTPKDEPNVLFVHDLVTAFYVRDHRVPETKGKRILDAGCGTGYKSLVLAIANPGAEIVGIDLSPESVKLAAERLKFHQFDNVYFEARSILDLPSWGEQFDYINCDEVLYLLPDPVAGLNALKSVLKPDGILRANLHSALQRFPYFRAQNLFKLMGLMDDNPEEMEMDIVREIMKELKDGVDLKVRAWNPHYEKEESNETLLANHLLVGDKGSTIPQLFQYLEAAGLEFISMVNWRHWNLVDLFKDPENLPTFLALSLPDVPQAVQLEMYELLHPVHRLLDFWCTPQPRAAVPDLGEWSEEQWDQSTIYLHPQLRTEAIKEKWLGYLNDRMIVDLGTFMSFSSPTSVYVDPLGLATLLPLFDQPLPFPELCDRYQRLAPLDPLTLEPIEPRVARQQLQALLTRLELSLFVLVSLP